jgi:hypothetical protein
LVSDTAPSPDAELDRAGTEYRAQAAASEKPVNKAVAELEAAQQPAPPLAMSYDQVAALLVRAVALLLPKLDSRLVYTPEEQAQLAAATAPVLEKWLPPNLVGPELALIATATILTLPKLKSPPKADSPAGGGPTDAKPSEAAPSTAAGANA